MNGKLDFLFDLIKHKSITPLDSECQNIIATFLSSLNFDIQQFQEGDVSNLLATRTTSKPVFAFIGHTDVVDPGALDKWESSPFAPIVKNDHVYGRGAADMKGNLTAFIFAVAKFVSKYPKHNGSISILLTSGEEGDQCHNGIPKILAALPYSEIEYCLVGEPTSESHLGDIIKIGRRGSLSGTMHIQGVGGHVAYPQHCNNPINLIPKIINSIKTIDWNDQDHTFDKTGLQFTNIYTPNSSGNVVPDRVCLNFNLRFNPNTSVNAIKDAINNAIKEHSNNFTINWDLFGKPFISKQNELFLIASEVIKDINGINSKPSTSGGTSDGRYIAHICQNIIELGCLNSTIHKPNEKISLTDLDELELIYYKILEKTLLQ